VVREPEWRAPAVSTLTEQLARIPGADLTWGSRSPIASSQWALAAGVALSLASRGSHELR